MTHHSISVCLNYSSLVLTLHLQLYKLQLTFHFPSPSLSPRAPSHSLYLSFFLRLDHKTSGLIHNFSENQVLIMDESYYCLYQSTMLLCREGQGRMATNWIWIERASNSLNPHKVQPNTSQHPPIAMATSSSKTLPKMNRPSITTASSNPEGRTASSKKKFKHNAAPSVVRAET